MTTPTSLIMATAVTNWWRTRPAAPTSLGRRVRRISIAIIAALVTSVGLLVPPASADPNSPLYPPDLGTYHSYCFMPSVPNLPFRDRIQSAELELGYSTNVNVRLQTSCNNTGAGRTDVRWENGSLSGSATGYTFCDRRNSRGLCDQHIATIDKAKIDNNSDIINKREQYQKTACHELGHTVTLSHYDPGELPGQMNRNDCMRDQPWDSGSYHSQSYEVSHHINDHINAWFCSGCTVAAKQDIERPSAPPYGPFGITSKSEG